MKSRAGDKSAKKEERSFFFLWQKKKKQEGLEQATDDMSDAEVAAEGATEAGEEETEPVADGDVHNLCRTSLEKKEPLLRTFTAGKKL